MRLSTLASWLTVSLLCSSIVAADGWQDLFDGKTLDGWQPIGGSGDNWSVVDGTLHCNGKPGAQWLATSKEYSNFELSLEFNVPENGNSGVFIRAPKSGAPWVQGLEVQVLDDYGEKWKNLSPAQFTGSIYAVAAPSQRATKKAGQWQTMRVLCDGRNIKVHINEKVVVDTNLDEHKSAAKKVPGINRESGHIGLQNHGDRISFRKLKLRTLEED